MINRPRETPAQILVFNLGAWALVLTGSVTVWALVLKALL
jgi:hypothetical protein